MDPITGAMAAGALFKGIGSIFGKKAAAKKEKEQAQNLYNAQQGQFDNDETSRLDRFQAIQSMIGPDGRIKLDPAAFAQFLGKRKKFSGVLPTKSSGTSLFGDILSGVGGAAQSFAQAKSGEDDYNNILCAVSPSSPLCPQSKKNAALGGGATFGNYAADPGSNSGSGLL